MHCLWCHEEIIPEVTWTNLFRIHQEQLLCSTCEEQLPLIPSNGCKRCSRPVEQKEVCEDCKRWESSPEWRGLLTRNISVYIYTPFMKDIMARWKYRGDYILISMFQHHIRQVFSRTFSQQEGVLVPVPLSEERLRERGFNQAQAIAELLPLPIEHALIRIQSEKQAKKSRSERLQSSNPFRLVKPIEQPVILVDDLYTTGMTIRWAAQILKGAGATEIYSFTLIRS